MRHVRLLCLLLIVKMVACNALLPAPTFSSQFAAHVCSPHMYSCGAGRRATIVITAASEASDPVRSATLCLVHVHCGIASSIGLLVFVCLCSCALHVQVRIVPNKPMRRGTQKAKCRRCQDPACTGKVASFGYEHDKRRVRCATHREKGMVYLVAKLCEKPTCNTQASFGQPDAKVSDA
jgi:EsV-1-7 cysteine-rich motif